MMQSTRAVAGLALRGRSIVMLRRPEVLGTRKRADESRGIVDQHGKVLRADPEIAAAILEAHQWGLIIASLAGKAGLLGLGHRISSGDR